MGGLCDQETFLPETQATVPDALAAARLQIIPFLQGGDLKLGRGQKLEGHIFSRHVG